MGVLLRRDAPLRGVPASTAIEVNPLLLEEVTALAEGRNNKANRKDKQKILDFIDAGDAIPGFLKKSPSTSADLLTILKIATKDTLDNSEDEGIFRNRQGVIGNRNTGEVVFRPPATEEVPGLIDEFIHWFNAEDTEKYNPVIEAGITHYEHKRINYYEVLKKV